MKYITGIIISVFLLLMVLALFHAKSSIYGPIAVPDFEACVSNANLRIIEKWTSAGDWNSSSFLQRLTAAIAPKRLLSLNSPIRYHYTLGGSNVNNYFAVNAIVMSNHVYSCNIVDSNHCELTQIFSNELMLQYPHFIFTINNK